MNDEVKQAKEIEATEAAQANAQQNGPVTEENTPAVPADAAPQGQAAESAAAGGDLNPEFEALVQALEAGEDPSEKLAATAAGEGGGGAGDSISSGVRLDRIDSDAFPNAGIDPDIPFPLVIVPTADTEIIVDAGSPSPEDDIIDIVPDDGVIVESGESFGGTVIENDNFGSDGPGAPPVVAVNGSPANVGQPIAGSLGGTLIINADGTYDYTPPSQVDHSDDIADTETFTYTIQDSTGDTATATVVFTIADTVPTAVDDTNSVTEDSQVSIIDGDVLANDISDADVPLSFISWGPETAQYGDITLNPDGTYSYSLTNGHPAVDALDDGETLTETFTYIMSDSDGSQDTATLTITIHGTNDAPVAEADTNWTIEDTAAITGNVLNDVDHSSGAPDSGTYEDVADTDVDGDSLTVVSVAGETGNVGSDVYGSYGILSLGSTGAYSYDLYTQADIDAVQAEIDALDEVADAAEIADKLALIGDIEAGMAAVQALDDEDPADTLEESFAYIANDGDVDSNGSSLTITVFGANDAPTIGIGGGIHTVYEAGLPEGSGVGPTTKEVTGTFTLADSDGMDDLDSVKVNTTTFTIAQLSAATVGSPLLVGDTTAGALYITDYNGTTGVVSYKYVLDTAITDVPLVEEQDVFSVSVSDDGTTFSLPALITVTIVDDVPVEITPDGLFLENKGVVGTSDQLISDLNFIAGADGVGTVKFNSADIDAAAGTTALVAGSGTSTVKATDADGNELSVGGQTLYLYLSADGTVLTASVGTTSGGTIGYTLTLDGAGGTYTFNPEAVISNGTEVTATSLSSVGGGNVVAKALSNIGGTTEDVLLTTKVGDTVNTNANAIGIGTGQSLTVGDGIRFDFVNGEVAGSGGNAVYTPDATHNLTNQFRQQVALTAGGSHADIKVQAILAEEVDDLNYYGDLSGETPIPITTVKVYSGTLAEVQAGTATEVLSGGVEGLVITDNGDGSFNIAGLQDGWTFEISTTAEFSAVQIDSLDTTDNYKLEVFSYGGDSAGEPIDLNYNIIGTDGDGDAVDGTVDVTLYPDAVADSGTSLPGTTGDDILLGTNGADTLNGAGGNDTLVGNAGDDTLNGDAGDDTLYGGSGNDTLNGGADVDILFGGSGDDDLTGGLGSDLLTGGLGSDTFIWELNDAVGTPTDTVTDFNVAQGDVLDLSGLLELETGSAANLDTFLNFSLAGGDTVIEIDADGVVGGSSTDQTIVLQGVDLVTDGGGSFTDAEIITSLLGSNSLVTDVV